MRTDRFGQFLINCGAVDEEFVLEALTDQRKRQPPIGQIALRRRLLSVKQILAILNRQAGTSKLFCETGVELGYLTDEDVHRLLEMQQASRPRIGEILVEMGKLSQEKLESLLERYHRQPT